MYSLSIITLSDSRDNKTKMDESGRFLKSAFEEKGYWVKDYALLKDEKSALREKLLSFSDDEEMDLILTTGGTGLSPRDITPETTAEVIEKEIPGLMEFLRHQSIVYTKKAVLSRGVAGIRRGTLIINLPGSLKAVKEYAEELWDILPHALDTIGGHVHECGR
ncbi:MAG: MogA/MoaB family molybdenum cofactor biosynthesis protein [Spirochaetales bacterium]|nr:MogA/MoaB family molybdenum cofactor biosynthesis protein [Spirochaetales bacterium]